MNSSVKSFVPSVSDLPLPAADGLDELLLLVLLLVLLLLLHAARRRAAIASTASVAVRGSLR
jgi:hypothetical protein